MKIFSGPLAHSQPDACIARKAVRFTGGTVAEVQVDEE
jgi:hypothetical protein